MARFFIPIFILFCALGIIIYSNLQDKDELASDVKIQEILSSTGEVDETAQTAVWDNKKVAYVNVLKFLQPVLVLGANNENKWIEVDLSLQKLYAHEGDKIVYEFPVSSGLPWMPTVTGDFRIWAKIFAQRMKGEGYDLPNVPFVQYFYKAYGLHGAYWHNDFGKPRSHGCVNLRPADAQALYYWTSPDMGGKKFLANIKPEDSTRVIIHGITPNP
ncbi:MAG: L,D-transpeptidase [Patescibacteria group bacterium]